MDILEQYFQYAEQKKEESRKELHPHKEPTQGQLLEQGTLLWCIIW